MLYSIEQKDREIEYIDRDPQGYLDEVFAKSGPIKFDEFLYHALDRVDRIFKEKQLAVKEERHALRVKRLKRASYAGSGIVLGLFIVLVAPHAVGYFEHLGSSAGTAINPPAPKGAGKEITIDQVLFSNAKSFASVALSVLPIILFLFATMGFYRLLVSRVRSIIRD